MTSVEMVDWIASRRLDPDDAEKDDIRHALMLDLLAKLLVPKRKGQTRKLPEVHDYLAALPWREEHRPAAKLTPKQLMAKINAAMRQLGGRTVER